MDSGKYIYPTDYNVFLLFILLLYLYPLWLWEFCQVGSCVLWRTPIIFWAFNYFLVSQDVLDSSCIFPASALNSATSPRSLGSFYRRMVFRNQDLSLGYYSGFTTSRTPHWVELRMVHVSACCTYKTVPLCWYLRFQLDTTAFIFNLRFFSYLSTVGNPVLICIIYVCLNLVCT